MLRFFCTENILIKKIGLVLNEPQMRLLLKNPGGTFLQIQADMFLQFNISFFKFKFEIQIDWRKGTQVIP